MRLQSTTVQSQPLLVVLRTCLHLSLHEMQGRAIPERRTDSEGRGRSEEENGGRRLETTGASQRDRAKG